MPMQTTPFKLDMNRFAPLEKSNSKDSVLSTRDEKTKSNVKHQLANIESLFKSIKHPYSSCKEQEHKNNIERWFGQINRQLKETNSTSKRPKTKSLHPRRLDGQRNQKLENAEQGHQSGCPFLRRSQSSANEALLKPAEEDNPSLYMLHVGTNDLKENKSVDEIAEEITSLARSLKKGDNEVTVSGICPRRDHLNGKATNVNETLEQRCKQQQIGFIKHKLLDATLHTNGSNLHLNQAGDSILAKSFLKEIRM